MSLKPPNSLDSTDQECNTRLHDLITESRDGGNGYYVSCRKYPESDEVEISGIKLMNRESLQRGGGGKRKHRDKAEMDEATLSKSISRAKRNVRRSCLAMNCDRMLTLTFRANVTELDEAHRVFNYFNKLMKKQFGESWRYVCVPEYQKRGAVHFHIAISGHKPVKKVRELWRRATGERGGNIDITSSRKANKNGWNAKRVANYISKYLVKSDDVAFNKRRYSKGGNIVIPEPVTGWLGYGAPVVHVFRQVIESLSQKELAYSYESEGDGRIIYCST
jgi:hypothetical protein